MKKTTKKKKKWPNDDHISLQDPVSIMVVNTIGVLVWCDSLRIMFKFRWLERQLAQLQWPSFHHHQLRLLQLLLHLQVLELVQQRRLVMLDLL
jgi:tRNA U54 and U55 pseudouridine synthase Pus10